MNYTPRINPEVRVYCPECKGGKNSIWEGTLLEWNRETRKSTPPDWFKYAMNHQTHHGHTIKVAYPTFEVTLREEIYPLGR